MKILETNRLTLHQVITGDAEFILTLLNDPSYIQNIGDRGVRTLDNARDFIQRKMVASYMEHGFGLYVVRLKDEKTPIGICGLIKRDMLDDVDIGYAFLPRYWSKGYAIESALAVKEFAVNKIGLTRLVGITDPENLGSIRVLVKLGMKFEKMIKLSTDDIDLGLYSIDLS